MKLYDKMRRKSGETKGDEEVIEVILKARVQKAGTWALSSVWWTDGLYIDKASMETEILSIV